MAAVVEAHRPAAIERGIQLSVGALPDGPRIVGDVPGRSSKGSGLVLAIAREIVQAHGGANRSPQRTRPRKLLLVHVPLAAEDLEGGGA